MICVQCGSQNPDHAAFCRICGGRLNEAASPPAANAADQPITPEPEVPPVEVQSPVGEYIQEMQPAHGLLMGQGTPSIQQDVAQAGSQNNVLPAPPPGPVESPTAPLPPVERGPWYRAFARPLPLWAFIGSIVVVIVLLVVLQLTGSDWAAGAKHVGIAAGVIAVVLVIVTGVRALLGMAAQSNPGRVIQLAGAGLAILLLLTLCLIGLTQQSTIHNLQGHAWEGQQQWQSAISEYQLAGEGAPASEDIARVYDEWGEQSSTQQHYQDAVARFNTVMTNYSSASAGVAQAQSDTIKAYLAWGQQASQQHNYMAATNHYDALLQLSYCTVACQSQANALDATAYYNLAESELTARQYSDADTSFHALVSRFAHSPEAQKVHMDYARALMGEGKQQLTTLCISAIPTYQQLSTQFGDTPEGQQATTALHAPQAVKGRFAGAVPTDPALTLTAALMHGLHQNMPSGQFFQLLNGAPTATIQRDGSFTFKPLKQGTYELAWGTTNNNDGSESFISYFLVNNGSPTYVANVGPLCPYDFGNIKQNIPVAP